MNFRVSIPEDHPLRDFHKGNQASAALESDVVREQLREFDQLVTEQRKGNLFVGLREGEFWKFKCTYKYHLGDVNNYR